MKKPADSVYRKDRSLYRPYDLRNAALKGDPFCK